MLKKTILLLWVFLGILFILAVFGILLVVILQQNSYVSPSSSTANGKGAGQNTTGLGSDIYKQIKNPIQYKLPDTNPIKNVNPINGAYQNPF